MGASGRSVRRSLGWRPGRQQDDGYRELTFNSKKDKWEWMKKHGLAEIVLQVKEIFGDIGEPVVKRRDPNWTPREVHVTPRVRCRDCKSYRPYSVNPESGMGSCQANSPSAKKFPPFPAALRDCVFYDEQK